MHPTRFQPGEDDPPLLLNPGPVNVTDRVARALLRGDLCHREPEYSALQARVRRRLEALFAPGGDHAAVLLTGSGTAAMEAAVSSLVGPDERLLVLQNGVYGERLAAIARAHGLDHRVLAADAWTTPLDPAALARALDADPALRVVAVVHHETTTGLLNPLEALAAVCRARGRALIVDAISSIGGEALDLGWGIDAVIGTANKCIRGLPGVSFVLARRALLARAAAFPPRTLYLHLPGLFAEQERGGTPFTPAVQVTYALDEALEELAAEGVAARGASCAALAARLREGCARLGLEPLLPPAVRSSTITTLRLPAGWTYERLHDALRAEGLVIYAGQGDLRRTAFRVATMGTLALADIDRVVAALGSALGAPAATAVILCAGRGRRLGVPGPKCLAEVGGRTLLARMLEALAAEGVPEALLVVGHAADQVRAAVAGLERPRVRLVENPRFAEGSVLSLRAARAALSGERDALVMDADVLFPREALRRLLGCPGSALLMDRSASASGEEMMLSARGGRVLRIARGVEGGPWDAVGEGVGFLKVGAADQAALLAAVDEVAAAAPEREYEDAVDRFLGAARVGHADVTDLPWTEVDFPEDLARARAEVLPAIERLDRGT